MVGIFFFSSLIARSTSLLVYIEWRPYGAPAEQLPTAVDDPLRRTKPFSES